MVCDRKAAETYGALKHEAESGSRARWFAGRFLGLPKCEVPRIVASARSVVEPTLEKSRLFDQRA